MEVAVMPCARCARQPSCVMCLSATDWVEGGWDLYQSVELAKLKPWHRGGSTCLQAPSSGAKIPARPNYQVPSCPRDMKADILQQLSARSPPKQAEKILNRAADAVEIDAPALVIRNGPLSAQQNYLGQYDAPYPVQAYRGAYGITL